MNPNGTVAGLAERIRPALEQQAVSDSKVDDAARAALVASVPGPLRQALAPNQDIIVGRWKVGPFRDCHYEWLGFLGHPLERTMTKELIANVTNRPTWVADDLVWERAKMEQTVELAKRPKTEPIDWGVFWQDVAERYAKIGGKRTAPSSDDTYIPRGGSMWQLAWIVTRAPQEVAKLFRDGGSVAVTAAAEAEFGMCTMRELMELYRAVTDQMGIYWSTTISHEEVDETKKDGAPDVPRNPL